MKRIVISSSCKLHNECPTVALFSHGIVVLYKFVLRKHLDQARKSGISGVYLSFVLHKKLIRTS